MKSASPSLAAIIVVVSTLFRCGERDEFPDPAGMRLIQASGASFQMGGDYSADALPVHAVNFTYDFWIDTTEVTQGSFRALMGFNPSSFIGDENRPVEKTTWFDAVLYCNSRSLRDGLDTVYSYTNVVRAPDNGCTGLGGLGIDLSIDGYRLPTEAEFEYALRGGTTTEYFWGDDSVVDAYAWFCLNTDAQTRPVATTLPNPYGLYDMVGNVTEWTYDWYRPYLGTAETDPTGAPSGTARTLRGGSWYDCGENLYSAYRVRDAPNYRTIGDVGFRCARTRF